MVTVALEIQAMHEHDAIPAWLVPESGLCFGIGSLHVGHDLIRERLGEHNSQILFLGNSLATRFTRKERND
jgi:hypothetical protein